MVRAVPVRPDLSVERTRIGSLRLERGLSQREVAERANLPIRTYRAIERDEVFNPGIRHLANIAFALDVNLVDVCEPAWVRYSDLGAQRST